MSRSPEPPTARRQTVLDTPDARALAEFSKELMGLCYRPGDEPPPHDEQDPHGHDWLVLHSVDGATRLAFQQVDQLPPATWPQGPRPHQLRLDLTVTSRQSLEHAHHRVLGLGGRLLSDRSDDPDEPLRVYVDPAGRPFCIFVVGPDHDR